MLDVTGDGSVRTCDGITRRDFLQAGTLGALGLTLPQLFQVESEAAGRSRSGRGDRERSVIMIFNLGAPSHLDTFDMKPAAPLEIRGPFKPIPTNVPGVRISELFPLHAKHADKFSLVRSCCHTAAAVHDAGHQMMQTGRLFTGGVESPHAGCAASFLLGGGSDMPAHVILPEPMGPTGGNLPHGQDAGFLGRDHDPLVFDADFSGEGLRVSDPPYRVRFGEARLDPGRGLRDVVDETVASFEAREDARLRNSEFQAAFRLLTSVEARDAFDLSKEPPRVRERYGRNRFGQCCLLARRLIEAGVRFVTVNTFVTVFNRVTWDIHGSKPFTTIEGMKKHVAPMYDRAYSALLEDLNARGMLEKTLVCNLAEFGRTPRINPAGGRDHWPQCWTVYFAGGGVQGGRIVGRSDSIGAFPAERPVTPAEVVATVYRSLGLDLDTALPGPESQATPLVDPGVREITELF